MKAGIKASIFLICVFISVMILSNPQTKADVEPSSTIGNVVINYYDKFQADKILLNAKKSNIIGSFGNLESTPMIMQPTTDFIKNQTNNEELLQMFKTSSKWVFQNSTLEEVRSIFSNAGLDSETCDELLKDTEKDTNYNGYVTTPDASIFLNLTSEMKSKLYPLIGEHGGNIMYTQPLYFCSDNADEWFYGSTMNEKLKDKALSLIYIKDRICYLSDVHLLLCRQIYVKIRISLNSTIMYKDVGMNSKYRPRYPFFQLTDDIAKNRPCFITVLGDWWGYLRFLG